MHGNASATRPTRALKLPAARPGAAGTTPPVVWSLLVVLCLTQGAWAADPAPSASGEAIERIRRTDPLTDSAGDTAQKAKQSLGQAPAPGAAPAAITLPATWLDRNGCATLTAMQVRLQWLDGAGAERSQTHATHQLDGPCTGTRALQDSVSGMLDQLRAQGFVITQVLLQERDAQGVATLEVTVLSLAQVQWPDGQIHNDRYGLDLRAGEPLRLSALDEVVELMGRLRRNKVHLDINPDTALRTAGLVVSNQEGPATHLLSSLNLRRDLNTWANNLEVENTLGLQERWGVSALYSDLPGGSAQTVGLDLDVPWGSHLFSLSTSQSSTLTPVRSGDSTSTLRSDEQDYRVGWKHTLYRNSQSAFNLSLDWQNKDIAATYLGVGLRSLSPKLSLLNLEGNLKHLNRDGTVWVANLGYSSGLRCCGANDDSALGVDDPSAAHAQFERWQAWAVYARPLPFGPRDLSLNLVGQYFYSPVGLFPGVEFAMASPLAVDGVFRTQSLADKGWSAKATISLALQLAENLPPAQLALSCAYAEGIRYNDGLSRTLYGATLELNFNLHKAAWTLYLYLPGQNSWMQNEAPAAGGRLTLEL